MIPLFFTNLSVSLEYKLELLLKRVMDAYGSDFYNVDGSYWNGDQLTVDSLFPDYILKEYNTEPSKVRIVPIIKNYLRWLFSMDYGYGAYINWENIRSGFLMDTKLLEGLAEFYFPGEDFASSDLSDVLPNIRRFSLQVDLNYLDIKGTPQAIKYVLVSLLGMSYNTTKVMTSSNSSITIYANVPDKYKAFLSRSVIPAGTVVTYQTP